MVKTRKMIEAENRIGSPLEKAIPEALEKYGTLEAVAEALDLKLSTLYAWMPRLGISKKYVVLAKNE